MRVTIVVSSLGRGGAERSAVTVAAGLAGLGHSVAVVTKHRRGEPEYRLPGGVRHVEVEAVAGDRRPVHRVRAARRRRRLLSDAIRGSEPDVVLSFTTEMNVRVLSALRGSRIPVVVSERNNPRAVRLPPKWRLLRRLTYRRADALVSLSHGVDECFRWFPAARRHVVHNALPPDIHEQIRAEPVRALDRSARWFVACGRLVQQKGFDILVDAFSAVAVDLAQWNLVIVGEGPDREALEKRVAGLGLAGRVLLPGRVRNPAALFARADVFVLSSRFEGFGNVVIEAMAAGLPVVAFDCPYGPAEIIDNPGGNGVLVPPGDIETLASAMRELAADDRLRSRMAEAGRERAGDFAVDRIIGLWEEVLERARHR